ncbi:MAG: hypothetical protein ACRYFW_13745 [Janthinobacterium lividum]
MTPVFLTIDTEFAWRHHAAGLPLADIYARSCEPAGVGVGYQLARLAEHGLRACFFVDPMPALAFGIEPVRRLVGTILDAGQEVQLHCHPNWAGAVAGDRGAAHSAFELMRYPAEAQAALIRGARDLLIAAGAPAPVAFRAGSFGADEATLAALPPLGIRYDSSHCGSFVPDECRIALPPGQIAPVLHHDVVEVPVTVIEEHPARYRPVQVCALSTIEFRAALAHAIAQRHAALTIVSHGFELAGRAGTRANRVHVRRFGAMCALLARHRDEAPTARFADLPVLSLGQEDRPLAPHLLRTRWRQAEQLWSNMVAERAA